ncbi:hypothetical protein [Mesorhizobium sp. M0816]|uniref:hypothetical protein n=1 Tax=Mesorhizobium sp. M0816 TaxID=2957006 RepID=UPI003337E89E
MLTVGAFQDGSKDFLVKAEVDTVFNFATNISVNNFCRQIRRRFVQEEGVCLGERISTSKLTAPPFPSPGGPDTNPSVPALLSMKKLCTPGLWRLAIDRMKGGHLPERLAHSTYRRPPNPALAFEDMTLRAAYADEIGTTLCGWRGRARLRGKRSGR